MIEMMLGATIGLVLVPAIFTLLAAVDGREGVRSLWIDGAPVFLAMLGGSAVFGVSSALLLWGGP